MRRLWAVVTAAAFILTSFAVVLATAPSASAVTNCSGTVPGAPTVLASTATSPLGTEPANNGAMVLWTPNNCTPASPVTQFKIIAVSQDQTVTIVSTAPPTAPYRSEITGLTNGKPFNIQVVADNLSGDSAPSNAVAITPAAVQDSPTAVVGTPANASVNLVWVAPVDNGTDAITSYKVRAYDANGAYVGSQDTGSDATSFTFPGLTNGAAYTFTVAATNDVGNGPQSLPSAAVTPFTVPGAPTDLKATPDNAKVDLAWTAPADDGGSPITGYQGIASDCSDAGASNGTFPLGTGTTATPAQPNGVTCTWVVQAINNNGLAPGGAGASSNAVAVTAGIPLAPTNVTAVKDYLGADVSWTAPVSTDGSPITNYTVTAYDADNNVVGTQDTGSGATTLWFTGLNAGQPYTFTVHGVNTSGVGLESVATQPPVLPYTLPGAPQNVIATPGNGQATITWAEPVSDGGDAILQYLVTSSCSGGSGTTTATVTLPAALQTTMTGLTNGTSCTFSVQAANRSPGNSIVQKVWGPASATSDSNPLTNAAIVNHTKITIGAPTAPQNVTLTQASPVDPSSASVNVTWTAPQDNGSAITGYLITVLDANAHVVGSVVQTQSSPTTVKNLPYGPGYTVVVAAQNARGVGPASEQNVPPITPSSPPGAPTNVLATPGNGQATITWTPPSAVGSGPITKYIVTVNPILPAATPFVGATTDGNTTSQTITGLTNGTVYSFTVTAVDTINNADAPGPASSPSQNITPTTVPGPPTGLQGQGSNGSLTLTWNPPADTGGSPITSYTVTWSVVGSNQNAGSALFAAPSTPGPVTEQITGLTPGTHYTVQITATNSTGTGPAATLNGVVSYPLASYQYWVQAAFYDFTGHLPQPQQTTDLAQALQAGTLSKAALVNLLAASPDRATNIVNNLYQDTLGRTGDPDGIKYWVNQIQSGALTVAQVEASFYSSPEFYQNAGGTDTAWVTALYKAPHLLNRNPDQTGLNYWVGVLANNGHNRFAVAYGFVQSPESANFRVTALYQELLQRAPDAGGLAYWSQQILTQGDIALAKQLVLSDEYFQKAPQRQYP